MKKGLEDYGFERAEGVPMSGRARSAGRDLVQAFLESGAQTAKKPGSDADSAVREYNRIYYAIRRGGFPVHVSRRGADLYLERAER